MWFPTTSAKQFLNKALDLPASGKEQDWEIELSNPNRIEEFLDLYQSFNSSRDIKQALMALILASFEDSLWNSTFDECLWDKNSEIVRSEFDIFKEVLAPWVVKDNGESFAISQRAQKLVEQGIET